MSSFQTARPWIVGIGLIVWLVTFLTPAFLQNGQDDSFDDDNDEAWFFWAFLLSWVLLLVLTGIAPAERQGLFVRYGAFLWAVAALLSIVSAFLLGWWVSNEGPPPEDSEWTFAQRTVGVTWFLILFAVTYLPLLSAIHLARFQVPRRRREGDRQVLVIRPRRPGKLALGLRIVGMVLVATAVITLLWTPIVLTTSSGPSGFLWRAPLMAGPALLGVGLLFVSRFADRNGPKRPRAVKPNRSRIVVEASQPAPAPQKK